MKIRFSEAAHRIGMHPCDLLIHLASAGLEFKDIWPMVEEEWVGILSPGSLAYKETVPKTHEIATLNSKLPNLRVTSCARQVLDKMNRKHFFGTHSATETGLRHLCPKVGDIGVALNELMTLGVLVQESAHGTYSLDPSKKALIKILMESAHDESG